MPVIFEKSAMTIVGEKLVSATVVLIVMAAFGSVFVMGHNLPVTVSIVAAGAILVGMIVFSKIIKEVCDVWKRWQSWQVEITDSHLIWGSPVPKIMEPFEIKLKDIDTARRVFITKKNSKARPQNKYYIDLKNGTSIEVSDQMSAIEPMKVFKALEDHGIEYLETISPEGSNYKFISGS